MVLKAVVRDHERIRANSRVKMGPTGMGGGTGGHKPMRKFSGFRSQTSAWNESAKLRAVQETEVRKAGLSPINPVGRRGCRRRAKNDPLPVRLEFMASYDWCGIIASGSMISANGSSLSQLWGRAGPSVASPANRQRGQTNA